MASGPSGLSSQRGAWRSIPGVDIGPQLSTAMRPPLPKDAPPPGCSGSIAVTPPKTRCRCRALAIPTTPAPITAMPGVRSAPFQTVTEGFVPCPMAASTANDRMCDHLDPHAWSQKLLDHDDRSIGIRGCEEFGIDPIHPREVGGIGQKHDDLTDIRHAASRRLHRLLQVHEESTGLYLYVALCQLSGLRILRNLRRIDELARLDRSVEGNVLGASQPCFDNFEHVDRSAPDVGSLPSADFGAAYRPPFYLATLPFRGE